MQHYVMPFASDLRQVGGFLRRYTGFLHQKTDCHDITEIVLQVALNTIAQLSWLSQILHFLLQIKQPYTFL